MPQATTPTPENHAAALAGKLRRIEWLMADNRAGWRPSFVAMLQSEAAGRRIAEAA